MPGIGDFARVSGFVSWVGQTLQIVDLVVSIFCGALQRFIFGLFPKNPALGPFSFIPDFSHFSLG